MKFDWYLFKNLILATVFITLSLTGVIFLTQSLRFLELVIEAGASASAFWLLTLLAMPRFFEIILPIALMGACLFIYNKMIMDSELVIMRAAGSSPLRLSRPAFTLGGIAVVFLLFITMWWGPTTLKNMHQLRQTVKAQYSSLLFKEGVFNDITEGLTVYIRERTDSGALQGIMIHDNRKGNETPVTVLAKRGVMVSTEDEQQVVVYDGVRQDLNPVTGVLNRLEFQRYTIDFPEGTGTIRKRWREPDERTFMELLNPNLQDARDLKNKRDFFVDAHRRIISPILSLTYVVLALCGLLTGSVNRRGQSSRIIIVVASVILIQGLYLAAFNLSSESNIGLVLMYMLTLVPLFVGLYFLHTGKSVHKIVTAFAKEET